MDQYEYHSSNGAKSLQDTSATLDSNVYKVFGTHGVQGGSQNPAYAVYTLTSL